MDYYHKEFSKLTEEFHEVMHNYTLFSEMIDDIFEHDIEEINELLEKNDEFYLKKAIDKLKKLIEFIKNTSETITKQYELFDEQAHRWEKIEFIGVSEKELSDINAKVKKANSLIGEHNVKALIEANKIMEELIKKSE